MDITQTTEKRFALGVELFVKEGHALVFDSVVFSIRPNSTLVVQCFSDGQRPTEQEAKDKILRSKYVLGELNEKSALFATAIDGLAREYTFCCDYGMGSIAMAREIDSKFVWLGR